MTDVWQVWDVRANSCVAEWSHHEDFVSDLASLPDKRLLLATRHAW